MKNFKNIYIVFAAVIGLTSCKKSFLDEAPPAAVNVANAIKTESDLSDAVNGMYSSLRSTNSFGTNVPILGDELGDNAYISSSNSGYFLAEQNYIITAANAEAQSIFSQCYYSILQANRIIYAANTLPNSTVVAELKGEAYTARALNYLTLLGFFSKPLTGDASAAGVPLVTTPTSITGPLVTPARATVGQVYTKIISDLDSAYAIMPASVSIPSRTTSSDYLSKYAAKAIESRAYLYKGDYANARDAALVVVQNGGYSLVASTALNGYWNAPTPVTNKTETIFELELNSATNNGTAGVDYFYNQAGYGQNLIYQDLYNQYSTTDARRGLFNVIAKGVVLNKYQNTSNTDKDNVKIIRYAEVLLTLAEGYARTGDNVNGLAYLNQVAKQRDPSFVGYVSVGTQLQSDIVAERRKELVGEGLRLADLNRLQLDINRPTQTGMITSLQNILFTDYRRLLPIPQAEVDANKSIVQNPGY